MALFGEINSVVLLVVGFLMIQGAWLSFITYLMYSRAQKKRVVISQEMHDTVIEDVFLLHKSGLLIRHLTRRLKPQADSDILSGMLRAVQEFVRDSFKEETGELKDMTFGELRISICSGRHVIMAAVIRGERPADILDQMKATLDDLEGQHGSVLGNWNGRTKDTYFVDDYLKKLLEGKYQPQVTESGLAGILVQPGKSP